MFLFRCLWEGHATPEELPSRLTEVLLRAEGGTESCVLETVSSVWGLNPDYIYIYCAELLLGSDR